MGMTVEEYRKRMIDAFHNADYEELITLVVSPTEKEFRHLEWLLKTHYKTPKDQYEERLKADIIAMLTDLQLEIEEIVKEEELIDKKWAVGLHYSEKIIQQKINTLKAESEVEDGNDKRSNRVF